MNLSKNFHLKIFITFLIALSYAIIRYNIFGNVPWQDFPLFITNKAFSLSIILMLLFTVNQKEQDEPTTENIWKTIFIFTSIHVLISFRLLGFEHYQKLYTENVLNLVGYFTLFFGITGFVGLLILNSDNLLPTTNGKLVITNIAKKNIGKLLPFLISGHLISMGFKGWFTPNKWPGYLLPITLIAFVMVVIYIIKIRKK